MTADDTSGAGGTDARDHLIVSPHPDDAVYSCFAVLSAHPTASVLTVLAGAPSPAVVRSWDRQCGFEDSDAAVEGRRAEDQAAIADLGHELVRLPLLEAPYLDRPRSTADSALLRSAVQEWIGAASRSPVVHLPVGAGVPFRELQPPPADARTGRLLRRLVGARGKRVFHALRRRHRAATVGESRTANPDHRWVRDTVLELVTEDPRSSEVEIRFYEDYPYLLSQDGTEAATALSARLGQLREHTEPVDVEAKRDRMRLYGSQLRGDASIIADGVLPSRERSWVLRRP